MRNRRFALTQMSDDEDEFPPPTRRRDDEEDDDQPKQKKRKKVKLQEDEEEEEEETKEESHSDDSKEAEDAKPVGEIIRVSGKGRGRRRHYEAFEFDGNRFDLEDPVLLSPEDAKQKPYVAIIKDISQTSKGSMMVTGQWFYRPEEAEKRGGGSWQSRDTRELFYSFHRDEVPAESVMHKCVVHFVPLNKQLPNRKQHPGFIVQRVYDTVERKLWKLTDKDYEDKLQHEIDLLVQKTFARLGDLPDVEVEENNTVANQEDQLKSKRLLRRKNITPLDVTKDDEATAKVEQHLKAETPGSSIVNASEYYAILGKFESLTGEIQRDRWLEKLLEGIQIVCKTGSDGTGHASEFVWPDAAVPVITALEQASHDALSSDFQKYNQKMRQLAFNLKSNAVLARRLLNGELEPLKILNMSPIELKEGLTVEERAINEPEESKRMQMTDARCKRCNEKKVGLADIIKAGHGDRYQLECIACGNTWYASSDEVSTLTIDEPNSARSVGTAPWATAKFEDVEKKLVSPRDNEKADVVKKTTEPFVPVLEKQKSSNKLRTDDGKNAD